jgi:hypothetical protein
MIHFRAACVLALLLSQGCQAPGGCQPPRDEALRGELLSAVKDLVGRWQVIGEDPPAFIDFSLSSNGTAVREIMFPGTAEEMTNMYSLDGNSLLMTHYCSAGNQPMMRAGGFEGNQLVFQPSGVLDLESPAAFYMSDMVLTFVGEDRLDETWRGMTDGVQSKMPVFQLKRVQ